MPVELAKSLKAIGHNPIVVSRSKKLLTFAESSDVLTEKGLWWSMQDWSGIRLLGLPIYFLWQLVLVIYYVGLVIKHSIDVVHPQSRDDFIGATLAARLLHKPVIWTDHADLKYVYRNNTVWYKNPVGKVVYALSKMARAVIIVSNNELEEIETNLGFLAPKNYRVIYNGVSDQDVTVKTRTKDDSSAIIFSASSRLVTSKGIDELISAFLKVSAKNTKLRLWLVGSGPEELKFKEMAKESKQIVFWGFQDDPLEYIAASNIFVHPSYHEGFSVSLIEATKLGLPIIACDVGGNPEIVKDKHNGLLVPARDSLSLAQAMEQLASNISLCKKYGKESRKIFENNFVWEDIVNHHYRELYEA